MVLKRKSPDQTLRQLVGIKEKKAEQALAAIETELHRVDAQIRQIELVLQDNRSEALLNQIVAYRAGNRFTEAQVRELQRLKVREAALNKQREGARLKLKRAIFSRQMLSRR